MTTQHYTFADYLVAWLSFAVVGAIVGAGVTVLTFAPYWLVGAVAGVVLATVLMLWLYLKAVPDDQRASVIRDSADYRKELERRAARARELKPVKREQGK